MAYKIMLDPGHGGRDPGAVYGDRTEKADNLALALAVGNILRDNGFDVEYTRTTDVYDTPYEKATIGNNSGADFFVSFHRNSNPTPNSSSGIETLVYDDSGIKADMARNINDELQSLGFNDRGVIERPNLVVLKRTKMPALLIETGFINNDSDNAKFDNQFDEIAMAIARGIAETLGVNIKNTADVAGNGSTGNGNTGGSTGGNTGGSGTGGNNTQQPVLYRVQVGAFSNRDNAVNLSEGLKNDGYESYIREDDGLYKVYTGTFEELQNAVNLEKELRRMGYRTYITTV